MPSSDDAIQIFAFGTETGTGTGTWMCLRPPRDMAVLTGASGAVADPSGRVPWVAAGA
jgi:hypothetical protein